MSEILHIKNFGPIKDVKLELKEINIFIGDQGTGKSTVGKLFSIIKNFIYLIIFNLNEPEKEIDDTWQFLEYLNTFEIANYLKDETEILYSHESRNIQIFYQNKKITTNLTRGFKIPPNFNYIVAERVFVSTLSDAFFGLNQFGTKLPTLFNRFGNKFSTARKEKTRLDYSEILNVGFTHINGVDSVILQDDSIIPLSDASTGLQGTIPLLVVFDNIVGSINLNKGSASIREHLLVIEEPELNLFPKTQTKLLNYIIGNNFQFETHLSVEKSDSNNSEAIANHIFLKEYKNQLLITTHSPYILTALNNLMYAYEVGQLNKEKVAEIVDPKFWVNPMDVSVYLLKDGKEEDIIDKEEMMIKAEMIDGVSNEINLIYAKLGEIKYSRGDN